MSRYRTEAQKASMGPMLAGLERYRASIQGVEPSELRRRTLLKRIRSEKKRMAAGRWHPIEGLEPRRSRAKRQNRGRSTRRNDSALALSPSRRGKLVMPKKKLARAPKSGKIREMRVLASITVRKDPHGRFYVSYRLSQPSVTKVYADDRLDALRIAKSEYKSLLKTPGVGRITVYDDSKGRRKVIMKSTHRMRKLGR